MKWRGWNGYTSKHFLRQETKIKEMQFIQNLHHLTKYRMTNKKGSTECPLKVFDLTEVKQCQLLPLQFSLAFSVLWPGQGVQPDIFPFMFQR